MSRQVIRQMQRMILTKDEGRGSGPLFFVLREAAGAFIFDGVQGVDAAGGTVGLVIDVFAFAEEVVVGGRSLGGLFVVRGPKNFCAINIFPIHDARLALGFI